MPRIPNSYVLNFDSRPDWKGSEAQRQTITETVVEQVQWGKPMNRAMHGLAVLVKHHTHNVTIGFRGDVPFGTANQISITLNSHSEGEILVASFWHELGHVVGMNFWSDSSEGWAHLFGGWVADGGRKDHAAWLRLKETLDSFAFAGSPPVT